MLADGSLGSKPGGPEAVGLQRWDDLVGTMPEEHAQLGNLLVKADAVPVLLAGSADGSVRLLGARNGRGLATLLPHNAIMHLSALCYSARQERLFLLLATGPVVVVTTRSDPCRQLERWDHVHHASTASSASERALCVALCSRVAPRRAKAHRPGAK